MSQIAQLFNAGGVSSGLTIGTTTITGGADKQVLFNDGGTVGSDAGLTFTKATPQLFVTGASGGSPGFYAQLTGDTFPRVRVGLNASNVASIAFGPGNAARDLFIERVGAGDVRFGQADAAAPVAQIFNVQSVVAGTSNTAGAATTFKGSAGTGTGAGGSFIWQVAAAGSTGTAQNALATALTLASTGQLTLAGNMVVNAASGFAGNLFDAQVAGVSQWKVTAAGAVTQLGVLVGPLGAVNAPTYSFAGNTTTGIYDRSGARITFSVSSYDGMEVGGGGADYVSFAATYSVGFTSGSAGAGLDTILRRGGPGILDLRNLTSAQRLNIYSTYTDGSTNAFAFIDAGKATANTLIFGSDKVGAPSALTKFQLNVDGTNKLDYAVTTAGAWTMSDDLLFPDGTYDIGAAATTAARSIYAATSILCRGATGGIGYNTGAGGTVTQATSRSTGVTLNKVTGQITTTADSLAAITIVRFTVTNSAVAATDNVIPTKVSGDADTCCWIDAIAAGSFVVALRNNDPVVDDTTAFVLNFAVIKGVTS